VAFHPYPFLEKLMGGSNCHSWVDASYSGSKVASIPIPKVHINGKINIRMAKKTLKTNV
jgi:hypothetical protein